MGIIIYISLYVIAIIGALVIENNKAKKQMIIKSRLQKVYFNRLEIKNSLR